jgi:hypothetical protein
LTTDLAVRPWKSDIRNKSLVSPKAKEKAPLDDNLKGIRRRFMDGNKPVKHVSQRKNVSKRTEGDKIFGK